MALRMLRASVLLFAMTVTTDLAAQWRVGVTAGYASNELCMDRGYAYDMRYERRGGVAIGIPVQYDFNEWLGVRAELDFVQKGHKMHRTDIYQGMHTDTRNNYLQLPVMASFSFGGGRVRGFLNTGAYIGGSLELPQRGKHT